MSIGTGLVAGEPTDVLTGIRPGDRDYVDHQGAVYHPQDESGNGNVPFYEIQNTGDQIDITLEQFIKQFEDPIAVFHSAWGATDFDIIERSKGDTLVSEVSGFDNNVWMVNLLATDGALRLTNFDTGTVSGTQAGWYAYVRVFERQ